MKNMYENLVARLKAEVPELKWIDLQKGQMNYERPPIVFPAALITIQFQKCESLNSTQQRVDALITIDFCFDFTGNTNSTTPDVNRLQSLAYFDVKQKTYTKLQGWGTADMNALSRVNDYEQPRPDGYKVSSTSFSTAFMDTTAAD